MAKGLKITNDKSSVLPPTNSAKENLDKIATEVANKINEYKTRSWDLGTKFKGIMESSILPENKSILLKNLETETLSQLCQLANDINNDDAQPEGTGSVALSQLIMKMLILQKDISNQQKFKIEKLESDLRDLKIKFERNGSL